MWKQVLQLNKGMSLSGNIELATFFPASLNEYDLGEIAKTITYINEIYTAFKTNTVPQKNFAQV